MDSSQPNLARTLGILSIVLGSVAFLFCPLVFGIGGLVCGILGITLSAGQSRQHAIIGTVISAVSIPAGILLALIVENAIN